MSSVNVGSEASGRLWPATALVETVGEANLPAASSVMSLVMIVSCWPMKTNAGVAMGCR